jgi:hypothetical protein
LSLRAMNDFKLNISDLIIRLDISGLKPNVSKGLIDIFSPFLYRNGDKSHETLDIIPIRKRWRVRVNKDLEIFIKDALKIPLSKFPFTVDLAKEIDHIFRNIKPFLADARFRDLSGNVKNPGDVIIYPLDGNGVILKSSPINSTLFLKGGYRQMSKFGTICGAVYFATSIALPMFDSFMLHGVGISRNRSGHLFLGLPGEGKTTLAGFSPPEDVISDDGIIVRRYRSGYYLDPAPLDQSYSFKGGSGGSRTYSTEGRGLTMGFFLERDDKVYLEKINPTDACSIILKNHIHFFRYFPYNCLKRTFSLITGLCRQVPFYKLHFKKDDSFWSAIEQEREKMI